MRQQGMVRCMAAVVMACGLAQPAVALDVVLDLGLLGQKWNGSPLTLSYDATADANDPCKKVQVTDVSSLAANNPVALKLKNTNNSKNKNLVLKLEVSVPLATGTGLALHEFKDNISVSGGSTVTATTSSKLGADVTALGGVYLKLVSCQKNN